FEESGIAPPGIKKEAAMAKRVRRRSAIGKNGLPVLLGNQHDNAVVERLGSEPVGRLAIDGFADKLSVVPKQLRGALARIYRDAAERRRLGKPTKEQLNAAKAARRHLRQGIAKLDRASTKGLGLRLMMHGSLKPQDIRGDHELNQFARDCHGVML